MWKPTTATKKILGLNKRLKAVFGGASAGKTYSIIPILIDRAVKNPGEVITIISDTQRNLRDGAMRDFMSIMRDLDKWDRAAWNSTNSKYTFKNDSVIEFAGADEPDKFRGPRRDRCYVNEANRISFETFVQIDSRTRKEMFLDWNPTSVFWYDEHIKEDVDHDALRLTYVDNEELSPQEVGEFERKKKLSKESLYWYNWWQVYGLGLTGQIEGSCIKQYKVVDKVPDGSYLQGIGLDFGKVHPNAAVAMYKNEDLENEQYYFEELVYQSNQDTEDLYNVLKDYDTFIYADYNWPDTLNWLQKMGLTKIRKCKKGPDSIKNGIDLLNELNINVTADSKNLIKEFNTYRYKEDKDGNLMEGKYEGPDHLVDACRYVLTKTMRKKEFRAW